MSETNPHDPTRPDLTVESEPHSVEDTGQASGDKLDKLLTTAITVREELQSNIRKIVAGAIIGGVALLIVLGAAAGVLWGLRNQADDLEKIAVSNGSNGKDIKTVLDSINAATGAEARTRSAIATADVIRRNVIEGDCRMRRVQARMPAPDPNHSCESQTPEFIYPGIAGEPPRD